jgi:hypothetical protein
VGTTVKPHTRWDKVVNTLVLALQGNPVTGPLVRRRLTVLHYTGRRSGRRFRTPVAYERTGDTVLISVGGADTKVWWRNFDDPDGRPLTIELGGVERPARATATRTGADVVITVTLAEPAR